ncbi:MAG: ChrR family anti-sigma-E factor [Sulfitobacter sp.]|nr:ChrR family anti-sigma-E factor [Sulfitobacter sp.]
MTIRHHIAEETLLAYATGNLPEAFNLIVAAHLSLCDECRATAESYDTLGGCLLEDVPTASLESDSLQRALARLDEAEPMTYAPARRSALPAPLQAYVGGDLKDIRWKPIGMGVKQAVLATSDKASARLLYIPAGTAVPDHSHRGREFTLVLQGAFADKTARFARGDVEVADDSLHHQPIAEPGEDCICLAVTDAPLQFSGWLPKIVQRFVGI